MNTFNLQLNKKISALSLELPHENSILRVLFIAIAAVIAMYLYLVSASVMNVMAQREADHTAAVLESDIGLLESEYFAINQKLTLAHAHKIGLRPIENETFVYRLDTVGVAPSVQNAI